MLNLTAMERRYAERWDENTLPCIFYLKNGF